MKSLTRAAMCVAVLSIIAHTPAQAQGWDSVWQVLNDLRQGANQGRDSMPKLEGTIKSFPQAQPIQKQEKMQPVSPDLLRFSSDYKNMPKAEPLPKSEPLPKAEKIPEVKGWLPGKATEVREMQGAQIRN